MSGFKIDGLDKFMATIERMPKFLNDETKQAVKNRTLEMETNAKNLAPVDTGHLKRNINSKITDSSSLIVGEISTGAVEYAPYVEYGTSKQLPQPFMTPSYVNSSKGLEADIKRIMEGLRNI